MDYLERIIPIEMIKENFFIEILLYSTDFSKIENDENEQKELIVE